MGRRIITRELQANTGTGQIDGYFDKLIKYIPTEVVGVWIAITNVIKSASDIPTNTILWIALAICTFGTACYILKQTIVPKKPLAIRQTIISTIAFVVWVFALGEPFNSLDFYRPAYGTLAMIFYTFLIPLIMPVADNKQN